MTIDNHYENEKDSSPFWVKDPPPVVVSSVSVVVSRLRHGWRWLVPGVTAAVVLALILALGVSNTKTSNRLWSVEQRVSNLTDGVIQLLNTSQQQRHKMAEEVDQLKSAVENLKTQLTSVSAALEQLSMVESLSKSVADLKCSLEHIINNSSTRDGCCLTGWEKFQSSCYFFSKESLSWNNARDWCSRKGAHLAILHTNEEWAFVTRRTIPHFHWIGLTDERTGNWEWVNQTPYVMERRRWRPSQPDNWYQGSHGTEDCAHLHNNGLLNDLHCTTTLLYVCQKHIRSN